MGYVYLLANFGEDSTYKIGVTRGDINKRIKKLQTGSSGEIVLISKYETKIPFFIEKWLHFKFCKNKIRNEWFKLSDEEVLTFKDRCKEIETMYNDMSTNCFFTKNQKPNIY